LQGPLAACFVDFVESTQSANNHQQPRSAEQRVRIIVPTLTEHVSRDIITKHLTISQKLKGALLKLVGFILAVIRRVLSAVPLIGRLADILIRIEKWLERQLRHIGMSTFARLGLKNFYLSTLRAGKAQVKKALETAAHPDNHPVLVHCQFGKDRTGLVSALLLHSCGVDRDTIINVDPSAPPFFLKYKKKTNHFGVKIMHL